MLSGLGSLHAYGPDHWRPAGASASARENGEALPRAGYVEPRAIESVERADRENTEDVFLSDRERDDTNALATYAPARRTVQLSGNEAVDDGTVLGRAATDASDPSQESSRAAETSPDARAQGGRSSEDADPDNDGLTEEEQEMVRELKDRDTEVRAHENAHASAGGAHAGAPTYTYQTGPDGKRYAIGGEVQIDAAPVEGDPEATVEKMRTVIRAAMAPAEPSAQDQRVAASATQTMLDAQQELAQQRAAATKPASAEQEPKAVSSDDDTPSAEPVRSDSSEGLSQAAAATEDRVAQRSTLPTNERSNDDGDRGVNFRNFQAVTRYQLLSPDDEARGRSIGLQAYA